MTGEKVSDKIEKMKKIVLKITFYAVLERVHYKMSIIFSRCL